MAFISDPGLLGVVLEEIPFGVFIVGQNREIIWANAGLCRLVGASCEEIIGRPLASIVPGPAAEDGEIRCRRVDDQIFTAMRTTKRMPDGSLLITLQAIPESQHPMEERCRLISENTVDVIWIWNLSESRCIFVTPSVQRLRGFTPGEVLSQSMKDALTPDSYQIAIGVLTECVPAVEAGDESARVRTRELEFFCKDGSVIATETITKLISDDSGKVKLVLGVSRDITERKLAQKALQQAKEKYREIFDGALEGIYRTSVSGRPLAVNPAVAKILGYDSPEAVLRAITDVGSQLWVDRSERSRFEALLKEQGTVRDFECRQWRTDGRAIWVSLSSRRVHNPSGEDYNEGFMEDVTERKRMEDALRQSEEKFSKAFLSSPACICIIDVEDHGRLLEVNEAFERISGHSRNEAIGRTIQELNLLADPRDDAALVTRLRGEGRLRDVECRYRTRSGESRIGILSAERIELDGHRCIIATTIDITERKHAEDRVGTMVTAIEQAGEQIVVTDLHGRIEYCNPAFEKISGYDKDEVLGMNPRILKSGKQNGEFYQAMWKSISSGSVWSGQFTNRRKDGSLYEEEATISPLRDGGGRIKGYVAVKRDVSERVQLENQFRQAQKLESIGRLAGGVAHDFNNLLTVINGYSGLLASQLKPYDPLLPYAEEIRKAGERGAGLTRQLLAFSRKQVIEVKTLDLNAIVKDAERMLERVIGEDIELVTLLEPGATTIRGDLDQLHQVIMNLVVNARDAMPDGGRLVIETRSVEVDETTAGSHPDTVPGRYVLLRVSDTGTGMDEKTQENIFEPFFTTKEQGKGTGLGLSTVYGIVRQSGGWIDVSSELGIGTTFKMYLPSIEPSDAEGPPQEAVIQQEAKRGSQTILLVEDHAEVRKLISAVLTRRGYRVIEARNGGEAYLLAEEFPEVIHLLLSDVVMPGMNGRELSDRLRLLRPDIKVLFSSGYTADAIADRGVTGRRVALLQKPFTADELTRKVNEVLAAGE